ncbi:hypothetical protein COP2_026155 [Malus domestica]
MLGISTIGDHCLQDEIMPMVLLGISVMGDHMYSGVIMLGISAMANHCLHDEIMPMVLLGISAMGDHTHSRGDDDWLYLVHFIGDHIWVGFVEWSGTRGC